MNITIKSFCSSIILAFLFTASAIASDSTTNTAVTVFYSTYYGSYSGQTENNSPSGEGSFICTDGYSDFSLTGTWEDGLLNGDALIQYGDGSYIEATYKQGLISGSVKEYHANGSYETYSCSDGRPNGLITHYDADDNITGFDYFYQMKPISDLKNASIETEYSLLLNTEPGTTSYKLSGIVLTTFDDSSSTYILFQDYENHFYILTYKNKISDKYNQAISPNLISGDRITAYGFLQKQASLASVSSIYPSMPAVVPSYSETSDSVIDSQGIVLNTSDFLSEEITLPFVSVFAVDLDEATDFDRSNPSFEYEDVIRNPYLYSNLKHTITGTVTRANINYKKSIVQMNLLEQGTENEYFIRYSFSEGDPLPSIGDTISFKGTYRGNDKRLQDNKSILSANESNTQVYIIYPRIHTSSITIQ